MPKVVVIGATGKQGGAVADLLLERGHEVVAYVRSQESPAAKTLSAQGARLAAGDLADAEALQRACAGADAVSACRCRSAREARTRRSRRDACSSTPSLASTSTWCTPLCEAATGWWPPMSTTPTASSSSRRICAERRLALVQQTEITAPACQLPAETGMPLSCWSSTDLATYDVHQARMFGRCSPETSIVPFMDLIERIMTQARYASAQRVLWVVDNGSSHRGEAAAGRLTARFPDAVMVRTPRTRPGSTKSRCSPSCSAREAVTPHAFTGLDQVEDRLIAFERRYNETGPALQMEVHPRRPRGPDRPGSGDTNRRSTGRHPLVSERHRIRLGQLAAR